MCVKDPVIQRDREREVGRKKERKDEKSRKERGKRGVVEHIDFVYVCVCVCVSVCVSIVSLIFFG